MLQHPAVLSGIQLQVKSVIHRADQLLIVHFLVRKAADQRIDCFLVLRLLRQHQVVK